MSSKVEAYTRQNIKELEERFKKDLKDNNTSICLHSITGSDKTEDVTSIYYQGLKCNSWGGILSNCKPFGKTESINGEEIINYSNSVYDSKGKLITVIIAIPEAMKDSSGTNYFLGCFEAGQLKGSKEADSLPMNKYVENKGVIPKEFIYGALITEIENQEVTYFSPNSSYILNQTEEEQQSFFDSIKNHLPDIKAVNEDVSSSIGLSSFLGINTYYLEQLQEYQRNHGITVETEIPKKR